MNLFEASRMDCRDVLAMANRITELEELVTKGNYAIKENCELRQRISELEEAQRWIPVSERLPEKNQLIDGYDLSTMSRMNGWYCGQDVHGKYVLSDGEFEYWFTHWRPLPPPPKSEKEDE